MIKRSFSRLRYSPRNHSPAALKHATLFTFLTIRSPLINATQTLLLLVSLCSTVHSRDYRKPPWIGTETPRKGVCGV